MIIDSVANTHKEATEHLKESKKFANWASEDRSKRVPPLTSEQRKQLQEYLALMAATNEEVYPTRRG